MRISFRKLFQQPNSKPKALAFVDYEHWFYSYRLQFGMKPNVTSWMESLQEKYDVLDVMVFAAFDQKAIHDELTALRNITNTIIETHQQNGYHKKDMTDFIMLDYIYQTAATRPEIDVFVLFTGDGHFHSVTKYLTQRLNKTVVIYGVKGAFSNQLKAVASESCELPDDDTTVLEYQRMIVSNLDYASQHDRIIATFNGTVQAVIRHNPGVSEEILRQVLRQMLDDGLLVQKYRNVDFRSRVKEIVPDWEKLHEAGLWDYANA